MKTIFVILLLVNSLNVARSNDKWGKSHPAFTNNQLRHNIGDNIMNANQKEIFKPVITSKQNYTGFYEVSNFGNVKSLKRKTLRGGNLTTIRKRILKTFTCNDGYPRVCLYKNGTKEKYTVHRLVGLMFIPNPENKPEINHKDFNRSKNQVSNLEWVTSRENIIHGFTKIGRKKPKGHKLSETTKRKISLANMGEQVKYNCDFCGGSNYKRKSEYEKQQRHFCNRVCYLKYRKN